jgi:hypothetical protein
MLLSARSLCDRYEYEFNITYIKYRWAMAYLGQAYTDDMGEIRELDAMSTRDVSRNRYGKGKVSTETINVVLRLVASAPTPGAVAAVQEPADQRPPLVRSSQSAGLGHALLDAARRCY